MKYTITQFNQDFPDDDACLERMFQQRYGDIKYCPRCAAETSFYKISDRKCYSCKHCGNHIYPLAGTIFHKSPTPLKLWFYAVFLFSASKNGVSAKELQRQLGVTYKTAWRMAKQIRLLMQQDGNMLGGSGTTVEADETYIGGPRKRDIMFSNKTAVVGIVEQGGHAKAFVTKHADASNTIPFLKANVAPGTTVHTDESRIYTRVKRDFDHAFVNHSKLEYVRSGVHTNTIEGFWGNWKAAMTGTYRGVSPKYLQSYVNEFVFRYNHRNSDNATFLSLIGLV